MPLIAKENSGAGYDPIPAGMSQGVCFGVVDLGTQPGNDALKFKPSRKVLIMFELPDERIDIDRNGAKLNFPRSISAMFTLSLHKKGKLRPALESWRGRAFTEAELDGFDLKNVLGVNALLNVIHEARNGKTYANISTISPLMKGAPKKAPENALVYFSIDDAKDASGKIVIPDTFPDWIKAKIMLSEEYVAQSGGIHHQPTEDEMANVSSGPTEDVEF